MKPQDATNLNDYVTSLFVKPKQCPDCNYISGGYRGTELCQTCYEDRYAEEPSERDHGDEA